MPTLADKYRPNSLADVVGQDKAVKIIESLLNRQALGGRAIDITGKSGTGKTTLAKIVAGLFADPLYITETVARQLMPSDLRQWFDRTKYTTLFGKSGHALIVNERHGLRKDTIEVLLDVLENLPSNAVVIFTTTIEGNTLFEDQQIDASPFKSRCLSIALSQRDLCKPFAARVQEIAQAEGLDGKPLEAYERLLKDCGNNFREALSRIEAGIMLN